MVALNTMQKALLEAGVVSSEDVERASAAERERAEAERREQERLLELDWVMGRLPYKLRDEMLWWAKETNLEIPLDILRSWGTLDADGVRREWSKWLAAYRESCTGEDTP